RPPATLRAGCEELADEGRCAGPMKRGPGPKNAVVERREARRPTSLAGWSPFARGDWSDREAGHGHGVPCQRLSALRSPRFGSKRMDGAPRAAKNRGGEACPNFKPNF